MPKITKAKAKKVNARTSVRTNGDELHSRQIEILKLLRKRGLMKRKDLVNKSSFGVCPGGSPGCGDVLGRYLGFPISSERKYNYPKNLLNRGLVKFVESIDEEDPESSKQVYYVGLTAKGKRVAETL